MTLDRTLKTRGGLAGSRSVLSRTERITRMMDEDKFDPENDSPLGLAKTKVHHSKAGQKAKKEKVETPEGEGEAVGEVETTKEEK